MRMSVEEKYFQMLFCSPEIVPDLSKDEQASGRRLSICSAVVLAFKD